MREIDEKDDLNNPLKPCPFCGGQAIIHDCAMLENQEMAIKYTDKHGVHCTVCYAATMPFDSEEEAVSAWNKRA